MNKKRVLAVLFALVMSIACDQVTKIMARSYLPRTSVVSVGTMPLKLHYSENRGGEFAFE